MQIIVNGKNAFIKEGSSFEYITDNRLFSGSDGYTLSITFPLKDCDRNVEIFGHINRSDVFPSQIVFDCHILDRNLNKFGCLAITEISEKEVKAQFLEGRSVQNFNQRFDNTYINELNLDFWPADVTSVYTPSSAWNPVATGNKYVALPWVNNYSGNIQNLANYSNGSYSWDDSVRQLSWQPYLIWLIKQICLAIDYDCDLTELETHEEYKYLLVCNTLPAAWNEHQFAAALPHWTIDEFFYNLELFLNAEFDIDHRSKRINLRFTDDVVSELPVEYIDYIVDEHNAEVSSDTDTSSCDYLYAKNLIYKECDHEMWKYYSCDWFLKSQWRCVEFSTMAELLAKMPIQWYYPSCPPDSMDPDPTALHDAILYARDVNQHFIVRCSKRELIRVQVSPYKLRAFYKCTGHLQHINSFGGIIVDEREDADATEISIVPAWIDETEEKYGNLLFLDHGTYDDPLEEDLSEENTGISDYDSLSAKKISLGQKNKTAEYLDRIYVGWWDGSMPTNGKLPHPHVESLEITGDRSYINHHFSLRLNDRTISHSFQSDSIDPNRKVTYKFLSDILPNPRAIFHINGKRYLCEKITATFTENGMSQLLKGEFYPIRDDG